MGARTLTVLALSLLLMTTTLPAVSITRVDPQYIEGQTFKRIVYYFTGQEYTGRRMITRSDPTAYEGYYFVLRLDRAVQSLPQGSQIKVQAIIAGKRESLSYQLLLPAYISNTREFYVGITGEHWPSQKNEALAWKLTLLSPSNEVMAARQSFLWAMPDD